MSNHEENEKESKRLNVVDRRRFDSDGNERSGENDLKASEKATPSKTTEQQQTFTQGEQFRMENSNNQEDEVSFSSFVMSLATQTLVQLGEMQPPAGMEIPLDVESARQTIEILGMLQKKTKGNLSSDENKFLEEILHTLRMSYVRKTKK